MAVTRIPLNLYIMQRKGSGRPWFLYYQEAWCVFDASNHRRFQGRMLALYFCSFCCFMWILISFLCSAVFFILSVLVCRSISRSFICCSLSFSILLSLASLSWCASTLLCSRSFSAFYKVIKIKLKKELEPIHLDLWWLLLLPKNRTVLEGNKFREVLVFNSVSNERLHCDRYI